MSNQKHHYGRQADEYQPIDCKPLHNVMSFGEPSEGRSRDVGGNSVPVSDSENTGTFNNSTINDPEYDHQDYYDEDV